MDAHNMLNNLHKDLIQIQKKSNQSIVQLDGWIYARVSHFHIGYPVKLTEESLSSWACWLNKNNNPYWIVFKDTSLISVKTSCTVWMFDDSDIPRRLMEISNFNTENAMVNWSEWSSPIQSQFEKEVEDLQNELTNIIKNMKLTDEDSIDKMVRRYTGE
ncbi:hypothetical protein [Bacillus bombysepticus]|uniref:hypothetical protein n=1 Tax=Bacillus bombysepticus TaxID=658666 RepID=UPI003018BE44